jgi:hypothetical protein
MQFLVCRKMLSHKRLGLVLRSSVASMKGWLRREPQGKNREIRSFASRSLCARVARAKVLKILAVKRYLVLLIRPIGCFCGAARDFDAHDVLSRCAERADSAAQESPTV